jgi:hypothetical protein
MLVEVSLTYALLPVLVRGIDAGVAGLPTLVDVMRVDVHLQSMYRHLQQRNMRACACVSLLLESVEV